MQKPTLNLHSKNKLEIINFLKRFYNKDFDNAIENISFENPIEMINIISTLIDNNDKYNISAWINLDEDIFMKVTTSNLNDIIKYLYERYPY